MFKKVFLSVGLCAIASIAQAESINQILVNDVLKAPYQYSDSILTERVQRALNANKKVCNFKDEKQLVTAATLVTMELRKSNETAEIVDVIEGLNAMLAGLDKPINCADTLGMYVGTRKQGASHSEAVVGGRVLMKMLHGIK